MIAATMPIQRPRDAKLLVVDAAGQISHHPRSALATVLVPGDLVVANDAATLPASLFGIHVPTGCPIEIRLATRATLAVNDGRFTAVVFGAGDFRTRTEDRALPPHLAPGDSLQLGPLRATVLRLLDHPRLVSLRLEGSAREILDGLARHGRPIQYAHLRAPLAMWDTWTPIAGLPLAFEPPSASFVLNRRMLAALKARGVRFATLTHAAGISSTGDPRLDARLPFDEPYRISPLTAALINDSRSRGARVVAVGTTVVRALEDAGGEGVVRPGEGLATQTIGAGTSLTIVDALVSGAHERGTSHFELLRAFLDDGTLAEIDAELEACGYRTHEFGDSVFVETTIRRSQVSRAPEQGSQMNMSVDVARR
jgi:S-adenosylmethionine:tRNA ribosyltransferase-isomerase